MGENEAQEILEEEQSVGKTALAELDSEDSFVQRLRDAVNDGIGVEPNPMSGPRRIGLKTTQRCVPGKCA
jgi:hypothetical protein